MAVQPIPDNYRAVTPYLSVKDAARAIEFYKKAFEAEELMRMPMPDGKIGHAELRFGDCIIMLADEFPNMGFKSPLTIGGTGAHLMFYVKDVDKVFTRVLGLGGKELQPVKDQFYGDRSGTLQDPFGHIWIIATHKEDLSMEELERRGKEAMKNGCS